MADEDDWRLGFGQEKFLTGVALYRKKFAEELYGDDHAHCEFCWAKFMQESRPAHPQDTHVIVREGYTTADNRCWICDQCFNDFRSRFAWKLPDAN
jgi:hypothetical protein